MKKLIVGALYRATDHDFDDSLCIRFLSSEKVLVLINGYADHNEVCELRHKDGVYEFCYHGIFWYTFTADDIIKEPGTVSN